MNDRKIDQLLVERAKQGDHKAFEMLVLKYQHRLIRLLSRFIKDEHEVNDVAQETLMKAYRALPNFRGDSAFYTWLYQIGMNTAKNFLSSSAKRALVDTNINQHEGEEVGHIVDEIPDNQTPETDILNQEILHTVETAINKLPEDLRKAITLREIEGLSYEKIAEIMNCPIGTVRSRIFRAREMVAKDLRPLLDTSENKRW